MVVYDVRDKETWIQAFTDSYHGGDRNTGRPTSGTCCFLVGQYGTSCPLSWGSRIQGATARNSCEKETVAVNEGMLGGLESLSVTNASIEGCARSFLQIQDTMEQITQHNMQLGLAIDNRAAEYAVKAGYSKLMGHLPKYQRVNLACMRDAFEQQNRILESVPNQERAEPG